MIELLALPIAGLADRVRGGYPEGKRPKWLKYLAMATVGPCLAIQVTHDPRILALSLLAAFTTMWRQDNGWRGRWVHGEIAIFQAVTWGLVASIPFLCLSYFQREFLLALPAFVIGAPLAIYISTALPPMKALELRHAWPWSELIELPIIGLIFNLLVRIF